jgi:formamidopyrimidine-DNA glycosylase
MPELPEVETVVNILNHGPACGARIKQITVHQPKLLKNTNVQNFTKFLVGEKINNFKRVGKYINVILSNDKICLIHLRMEGKLFCENAAILNQPHRDMNESKY